MVRREEGTQRRLNMTAFIISETCFISLLVVDGLFFCVLPPYLLSRIMGGWK